MSQLTSNKKQPDIRFGGFSGDWVEKFVADIGAGFTGGGTPSTQKSTYWNGDIPWLQSSDFNEDDVLNVTPKKYITLQGLQNSATKIISENSIAIVTRVGVGKLAFIPYQFATSQDFLSIGKLNIDNLFAVYVLYLLMKKEGNITQGTSIKGITNQVLLSKKIVFPIVPLEQTTIGNFFKQLDNSIALHKRKHRQTQQLKKAMLGKLFPQKGQNQPEIRLQGFSEDWVEKKLGDIAEFLKGQSLSKSDIKHRAENPCIHYGELFTDYGRCIDKVKSYTELEPKNSITSLENDILMPTSDVTPNGLAKASAIDFKNVILGGDILIIRSDNILNKFFAYFVEGHQKEVIELVTGTTVFHIYGKDMAKFTISLPKDYAEQTAIGHFFKQLDDTLALQTQQINTLENLKKAFLQKMFV